MADSDIRTFNYYDEYIWQAADFTNMQKWLFDTALALAEGISGPSILSGLSCQPAGGLLVQVNPGIGATPGQPMVVPTAVQVAVPSPVGNPAKNLVVLRPTVVQTTLIPEPLNPVVNVPLHNMQSYMVVVIPGTPAASPAYPATQAGDVVLMGVILSAGAGAITQSNFDLSPISTPRQKLQGIVSITANYSAASGDLGEDIIEADATSAAASGLGVTLPPAASYTGRKKSVIKVDSSANPVLVLGNGAELVSGEASITLDDQWAGVNVYSNGLGWRVL